MNIKTVEYGLVIRGVTYEQINKQAIHKMSTYEDGDFMDGVKIYGMYVEGHPWRDMGDDLFMSWGDLGNTMPKEPAKAKQVRKWFKKHLPKAKLAWEIIRTER
jgi:hypothetical protein